MRRLFAGGRVAGWGQLSGFFQQFQAFREIAEVQRDITQAAHYHATGGVEI